MKKERKTQKQKPENGLPTEAATLEAQEPPSQPVNRAAHVSENGGSSQTLPEAEAALLRQEIQQLRETLAYYQDRYDYLPVGSLIMDAAGLICEANRTFFHFLNQPRPAVEGQPFLRFIPENQALLFAAFLQNMQQSPGKQTCELWLLRNVLPPLEVRLEGLAMPGSPHGKSLFRVAVLDITEQKNAERKLIESQLFVQKIADATPDILTVYDTQARRNVYGNREILSTLGLDPEEIKKTDVQKMLELVHPDDVADFQKSMLATRQLRDGEISELNYRIRNKEGKYLWLNVRTVVFQRLPNGEVSQILSIQKDVTFKKEAEEAIRYKDQVISGLLNNLPVVVTLVGQDGTIQALAGSGMKVLEKISHTVKVGDNLYQEFPGIWSYYQTVFQTKKKVSYQYTLHEDPNYCFQNYIFLDATQNAAICFSIDISDMVAARKKAVAEREFSQTLLDNSMDGILAYDQELRLTAWNKVMAKSTNLTKEAVMGKRIFDLFPELRGTELGKATRKVLQGKSIILYNQAFGKHQDVYEIYLNPLKQEQGKATGALCVFHNINEQKKLEAESTQLKLEAQKTVMNAVLALQENERRRLAESLQNGLAQLLIAAKLNLDRLNGKNNAEAIGWLKELLEESIQEVRSVSAELRPRILEDFGLETALQELLKHARKPDLKWQFHTTGLKRLPAETEVAVYRMVQELVNNVLRHANATRATLEITGSRHLLTITVKDNGIGFDEKSTLLKATGIGLNSIRNRVKLLNGEFSLETAPGAGTLASIEIELSK